MTVVQVSLETTGQGTRDSQKLKGDEIKMEICIRNDKQYKVSELTKVFLFLWYFEIFEDCTGEGLDEKYLGYSLCVEYGNLLTFK